MTQLLHFLCPQIHLIHPLWLWPALHPGCDPAATWPGPSTLQADRCGHTSQYLAPLQDRAGSPASPATAAFQEHHHHLPQENQCRLCHGAELRQPPAFQALPIQRGPGGGWQERANSVRVCWSNWCFPYWLSFPSYVQETYILWCYRWQDMEKVHVFIYPLVDGFSIVDPVLLCILLDLVSFLF